MNQSADSNALMRTPTKENAWDILKNELNIGTYDYVLAWIFILGTVAGVVGNSCAVCFFWPRRKKTIHDLLYLSISNVDLITVIMISPLTAPFLNGRFSSIFRNEVLKVMWISVMSISIKFSIFLAMVICVTRTMNMRCPKRPINRSWIIGSMIGYFTFLFFFDVITVSIRWIRFNDPCCSLFVNIHGDGFDKLAITFQTFVIFIPSLIIFICFIVGIRILLTRPALSSENRKGFRRVSITISIFTAVFLFFNIPCSIKLIWNLLILFDLTSLHDILPDDENSIDLFDLYVDVMLVILPMFLNAIANPILYVLRMKEYQNWVRGFFKNLLQRIFICPFHNLIGPRSHVETAESAVTSNSNNLLPTGQD